MNNEYHLGFPPPSSPDLFRRLERTMLGTFEDILKPEGVNVVHIHHLSSGLYGAAYNVRIVIKDDTYFTDSTFTVRPMYVPKKQVSVDTMSEAVQARVATLLTFPMDITQLAAIPGVGIRMLSRMIVLGDDNVDGQNISVA